MKSRSDEINEIINEKTFFIVDGDGTLYSWDKPKEGSKKFLEYLSSKGKKFVILSNNDSMSHGNRVRKLSDVLEIPLTFENLVLPNDLVINYLKKSHIIRFDGLITNDFKNELINNGFKFDTKTPEIVIIGFDTELNYDKISRNIQHINANVKFILTHTDVMCPYLDGREIPDVGVIYAMVKKATKRKPKKIFGKPYRDVLNYTLKKYKFSRDETIIIGDRLITDIKMANENHVDSIWLYNHEESLLEFKESNFKPTIITQSLQSINENLIQ
jgi:HAD superfamily hydrolase (TIGR01450 family)